VAASKAGLSNNGPAGAGTQRMTIADDSTGIVKTKAIVVTPTITAGVYAAKEAVGGLMEFANAARAAGDSIKLQTIVIADLGMQSAALVLVLYDRTFTATADNAPLDPSDADLLHCIGSVPIATGDYQAFVDNAVGTVRSVGLSATLVGTSLFAQLMCVATPTYVSTGDLQVTLTVEQY